MTPERQQLIDYARELWNENHSSNHVMTFMSLEGYSPAELRYIERYVKQWECGEQNGNRRKSVV